jgi:hypothetical protein
MDDQEQKPDGPPTADDPRTGRRRPRLRVGAAVALAAGAGLAAWAIVGHDGAGSSSTNSVSPPAPASATTAATAKPIGPVALSAKGLRTLTSSVHQPVYWAGPQAGYLYELTRTSTGRVFIRYLPPGVKAGAKQQKYLIIATYPFVNPVKALKNLSGTHLVIPGGGVAMVDRVHPQSVHLAYPGVDDQVEIYDPSPARSLRIARSGEVRPVSP